jgi:hypothetical protein
MFLYKGNCYTMHGFHWGIYFGEKTPGPRVYYFGLNYILSECLDQFTLPKECPVVRVFVNLGISTFIHFTNHLVCKGFL